MDQLATASGYKQDQALLERTRSSWRAQLRDHADVQHTMTAPLEVQLSAVRALFELDKTSEALASSYGNKQFAALLLGAAGAYAGAQLHPGVGIAAGVAMVVALVVLGSKKKAVQATDMDDRKLDATFRPLVVLGPDIKRGVAFEVFTNFYAYDHPGGQGRAGRFDQQWLRMQLPMLDGSAVLFSVRLRVKRKVKVKRKGTKVKEALGEQVTVTVKLPSGREIPPGAVEKLAPSVTQAGPNSLRVQTLKGSGRRLTIVFATPQVTGLNGFLNGLEHLVNGDKLTGAIVHAHRVAMAASGG